jgi:osmotically-inducible protein OsmY
MLHTRGAILTGLGVGAGLMYFMDPTAGARRRARLRDRLVHAGRAAGEAASATRTDVANRASGLAARMRRMREARPVDDRTLTERVRARLGRVVSHPRAIDVSAANGVITLRGTILRDEIEGLCRAVSRMDGVSEVIDALDVHDEPVHVPALQRGRTTPAAWRALGSPTGRMMTALAATAGAGLLARAVTRH